MTFTNGFMNDFMNGFMKRAYDFMKRIYEKDIPKIEYIKML